MARRERRGSADDRARRDAARLVANVVLAVGSLAVLGFWAWFGIYQLEPGQSAVILRFGEYARTVEEPGLKWHLPPPLESHEVVPVAALEREEFGTGPAGEAEGEVDGLAAMQTRANNIVNLSFVVQYRIRSAFESRYRIARPHSTLRDAAQAAVREVVGRTTIEGVLSERRGEVEVEAQKVLQTIVDSYDSGLRIVAVQLQEVQPPPEVRDAFDDVIAAMQDRSRAINEAEGYVNEVLPQARAKSNELREEASAYRDTKIADATGEAARFRALADEYRKAPDVTRTRLYLEAMESVLPDVEKVIIDPEAGSSVLPHFPIQRGRPGRRASETGAPETGAPETGAPEREGGP